MKNWLSFFTSAFFIVILISCNSKKQTDVASFDDFGKKVVAIIKTGKTDSLLRYFPDSATFYKLQSGCLAKDDVHAIPSEIAAHASDANAYRNALDTVIKSQLASVMNDLSEAKFVSVTAIEHNDCAISFKSTAEFSVAFTIKNAQYNLNCNYVAQTKDDEFYFLDKITIIDIMKGVEKK